MNIDLIVNNNANLRPRDEVKIEKVTAAPYPDNRRVKVEVELTPFRERPNLEIVILDSDAQRVTSSSAVALMNFRSSYVLHLRGMDDPTGTYTVYVALYYESLDDVQDTHAISMAVPAKTGDPDNPST